MPAGILRRYFYPRSPCGERLCDNTYTLGITDISIHALLAESDDTYVVMEATKVISIHALLAESDLRVVDGSKSSIISIHALLAESDRVDFFFLCCIIISIHALLAESDGIGLVFLWWGVRFLSTLSLRRATISCAWSASKLGDFYPRSPCGERHYNLNLPSKPIDNFYPRSPCGERRTMTTTICTVSKFLSTLSLRRATAVGVILLS